MGLMPSYEAVEGLVSVDRIVVGDLDGQPMATHHRKDVEMQSLRLYSHGKTTGGGSGSG